QGAVTGRRARSHQNRGCERYGEGTLSTPGFEVGWFTSDVSSIKWRNQCVKPFESICSTLQAGKAVPLRTGGVRKLLGGLVCLCAMIPGAVAACSRTEYQASEGSMTISLTSTAFQADGAIPAVRT